MTVNEFFDKHCRGRLKIMSGYDGRVLCKYFNPKKHSEVGEREVLSIWAEIEATKVSSYSNTAFPVVCAFVDGRAEAMRALTRETNRAKKGEKQ